jgi:peptidoglycan/xylan/chitin deacetylase (PgdA/CDA1 family)
VAFRVALTFDAEHADRRYQAPDGTARVLDRLAAEGIRATFFVQGRWAEAEPVVARRIADEGHLVGNHTHHHARMTGLTSAGRGQDLRAAQTAIRRVTGVDPRPWFRCPFGDGMDDPGVLADIVRLGYRSVGWDVDSCDWQASATGPLVARRVVDGARAHGDGAVVLEHPWTRGTGRGLGPVIEGLRAAGATFVRLDELPRWSA